MQTITPIGATSTRVTGCGSYGTPVLRQQQSDILTQGLKDIMTPEQVAEYLCIDVDTLATMVRGYQIPVVRLKKGLHRFSRRQIEAWLDEKAIQKCNDDE